MHRHVSDKTGAVKHLKSGELERKPVICVVKKDRKKDFGNSRKSFKSKKTQTPMMSHHRRRKRAKRGRMQIKTKRNPSQLRSNLPATWNLTY